MTENSKISQIMMSHKNDWRTFFKNEYPRIAIKEDGQFAIFNYLISADFSDPIVREARGIILDTSSFDVVCWPFTKFCKYDDKNADEIDWTTARIEQKIDGSIIKLWYNSYIENWQWSTDSTINAKNAKCNMYVSDQTFLDVIKTTKQYDELLRSKDKLNKNMTYIFELVSLSNQVVIRYDIPELYLTGIRNNITGEELNPHYNDIGMPTACIYPHARFKSLDDCIKYLDDTSSSEIGSCLEEGFVVVDASYNRIKVKSPVYLTLHGLINNNEISVKYLIKLLYNDKININEISKLLPRVAPILKYYDFKLTELLQYMDESLINVRKYYNTHNMDNKLVADKIKNSNIKHILFIGLDNTLKAKDLIDSMKGIDRNINYLHGRIPEYNRPNKIDFSDNEP